MAGLFGYVSSSPAAQVLRRSIKSLLYSGCDSWGILTCDDTIHLKKGLLQDGEASIPHDLGAIPGERGLAHTRWATHGGPSEQNAHPITDCTGTIAVTQNGIIENHEELRSDLKQRGHVFSTETDTEVVPHLIEDIMRGGVPLSEAVASSFGYLKGSFSLAIASTHDRNLYSLRNKHPLYLGLGNSRSMVTSEPSLFPGLAYRAVPQPTGSIAMMGPGWVRIKDIKTGREVTPAWVTADRRFLAEKREGFRHYLEKEINQEPDFLLVMALGDLIRIDLMAQLIDEADRIYLLSDESSYNSSLVASHLLADIARVPSWIYLDHEFPALERKLSEGDMVIAMTSGRNSSSLHRHMHVARRRGVRTGVVSGNGSSALSGITDGMISLGRGGMPLSPMANYVAQAAVSLLLAQSVRGKTEKAIKELTDLGKSARGFLPQVREQAHVLATSLYRVRTIFVLGRNTTYPMALEAAREVRVLTNIDSIGLENPRGKELNLDLGPGTVCLSFATRGDKAAIRAASQARAEGARIIGISESESEAFDDFIRVPPSPHLFPVSGIIPAQILAYETALLLGMNPDRWAF